MGGITSQRIPTTHLHTIFVVLNYLVLRFDGVCAGDRNRPPSRTISPAATCRAAAQRNPDPATDHQGDYLVSCVCVHCRKPPEFAL